MLLEQVGFLPEKGLKAIPVPKSLHFRQKSKDISYLWSVKKESLLVLDPFQQRRTCTSIPIVHKSQEIFDGRLYDEVR